MSQYSILPPPYVQDGKFLSSYFVNQLSECVNTVGGAAFGANVPRWIESSTETLYPTSSYFSIVHTYDILEIKIDYGTQDIAVKVYLTNSDVQSDLGAKVYEATTTASGPLTLTFDLSTQPNGFLVDYGELYFIKMYISFVGTPNDFWQLNYIREIDPDVISKPTLSNVAATSVLNATYLNSLVNAARNLRNTYQQPSLPFVGFKLVGGTPGTNGDQSYIRYKLRHLSRWLHYSFKGAEAGDNQIKIYINNTLMSTFSHNNGASYIGAWDMTNLPNGLSEPTFGAEYTIHFDVQIEVGAFYLYYLWEMPYL